MYRPTFLLCLILFPVLTTACELLDFRKSEESGIRKLLNEASKIDGHLGLSSSDLISAFGTADTVSSDSKWQCSSRSHPNKGWGCIIGMEIIPPNA